MDVFIEARFDLFECGDVREVGYDSGGVVCVETTIGKVGDGLLGSGCEADWVGLAACWECVDVSCVMEAQVVLSGLVVVGSGGGAIGETLRGLEGFGFSGEFY